MKEKEVRNEVPVFFEETTPSSDEPRQNDETEVGEKQEEAVAEQKEGEADVEGENTEYETSTEDEVSEEEYVSPIKLPPTPLRCSKRVPKANKREEFVYEENMCFYTQPKHTESRESEPTTVEEAMRSRDSREWQKAIQNEHDSLMKNDTWEYTDLPEGVKPLDTKWVFKKKVDENNQVKFKARLVARGCKQKEGVDYNEIYSPVLRYTSLKLLFAYAVKNDMHIHHMDVNTAYLQGTLEEDIYIQPPSGIKTHTKNKVCKLRKAIYGLKQSGRVWNAKLNEVLTKMEFQQLEADNCVYIKHTNNEKVLITVYVDDILIFSKSMECINDVKTDLKGHFDIKDLGEAKKVLGLQLERNLKNGSLTVDQSLYIKEILQRYNMADCKPTNSPLDSYQRLSKEMEPKTEAEAKEMENKPYREIVGSLMYLTQHTRPDITYAVNLVSRFSQNPGKVHLGAIKRILRYLKGTINVKLHFVKNDEEICGYSDADWAEDRDDRKSTLGYIFMFQGGAVSWASKKQPTVANSTTEAEYTATAFTTKEALWIRKLLTEIDPQLTAKPITIHSENRSSINLCQNEGFSQRTKHMDVRHHLIKENVEKGVIKMKFLPTEEMLADPLTKPVSGKKIMKFSEQTGLKMCITENDKD